MAHPDIVIAGNSYPTVPKLVIPKSGGGSAEFHDMSDPMSFLGKEVESVNANVYTSNFLLKDTDWHGWTPSTTAQVLIASVNVSQTFTATDMVNNEYFLVWECGVTPVYDSGYTDKARPLKSRAVIIQELCRRPSNIGNVESANFNGNACVTANASSALIYWNAASTPVRTVTWSASYGFYFGATAATFSNSTNDNPTVTVKTPTLTARCSTTYMSTANAEKINEDDSAGYIRGKLYRIKRNGEFRSVYEMLVSAFNA